MLYLPLLHGGHSSAEQAPPRVMAVPRGRPTRRLTGSPSAAVVHPTQACNRARARRCCPLLPSRSADGGEEHGERTPRWHSRLRSSPKVPNAALCCDSSAILLNLWSTSRGAPQPLDEPRSSCVVASALRTDARQGSRSGASLVGSAWGGGSRACLRRCRLAP